MVIAWEQMVGENPILYYDSSDWDREVQDYAFSAKPQASHLFKGMRNYFVELENLKPDTAYFFIIADSNSISQRMWFKTAPAGHEPFTFIAGGNSYNNRAGNIRANKMTAKLQPLFVLFTGDMTPDNSSGAWQTWLDEWQETLSPHGRIIPIIPARGERERYDETLVKLFHLKNPKLYHALSFGDDMLRLYTLNSETMQSGAQGKWLENDLKTHGHFTWRFSQYHDPMRPHNSAVRRGREYDAWARLFHLYRVQLAIEGHGQTVKSTYPIQPSTAEGHDQGFVRSTDGGTVYVGEGTWGSATRPANAPKSWTREKGAFPQFKWVSVARDKAVLRTVLFSDVSEVEQVQPGNPTVAPANLKTWHAGEPPITLINPKAPRISITQPRPSTLFKKDEPISIEASMEGAQLQEVALFVDHRLWDTRSQPPWSWHLQNLASGNHLITVKATSLYGITGQASVHIGVEHFVLSIPISNGQDDVEEWSNGRIYVNSTDFEFTEDTALDPQQTLALRFRNVALPKDASILWAVIQFTVDELSLFHTHLQIVAQASGDGEPFTEEKFSITNRPRTRSMVQWSPLSWTRIGASGPAQKTPNLGFLVDEVIHHKQWQSGNAMVFIFQGTGRHVAKTYEGLGPATLHIAYSLNPEVETGN